MRRRTPAAEDIHLTDPINDGMVTSLCKIFWLALRYIETMYSQIHHTYMVLFFAAIVLGMVTLKVFYRKFVEKDSIRISESDLEMIMRKNRAARVMNLILGILGCMGTLVLFLIPLLLKWPDQLDMDYVVLVIIMAGIFTFFVITTINDFNLDGGMRIRREGEDIFVNNNFFAKLSDVKAETVKHVNLSGGYSSSYYVRLHKNGGVGLRLAYGLSLEEAEGCMDRLNSFFSCSLGPK